MFEGATTAENLAGLQPAMTGVRSLVANGSASDRVYAAVTTGACLRRPQERAGVTENVTGGYVVFNESGPLFASLWLDGMEQTITAPFGPTVNAAFETQHEAGEMT